uniref:Glycosyltransferase n=1 Tax=Ignisphaera aggregans TaxID=334771 RepID=A0A7J3YTI9_9CREN
MKVAVIYDFSVNKGGGDFVMLNILEALCEAGYDVSLFTSYPNGLQKSADFFDKPLPKVGIYHVKVPSYLRHPYTIAYVARRIVEIGNNTYDAYMVSDDVPRCIAGQKGVCYMHYPHVARFKFKEFIATKYKTTLHGRIAWKIHEILFPSFYLVNEKPRRWMFIANSIVTRRHAAEVLRISVEDVVLINPPVAARRINEMWRNSSSEKENLVVCVGRFEFEKRFTDVLQALARLKKKINVRLSLIGFSYDEKHVFRAIRALGLEENVELLVNAERRELIDRLLRAKVIVHPAPYEPFGIAVVEGMAAGCIPVIRKGFNGPWLEITQEGRYGIGFSSLRELAGILERAIKYYDSFNIKAIISRALEFDEAIFRTRFIKTIENFTNTSLVS